MGRLAHAAPGATGRRPRVALAARGRQLLLSFGGAALVSLAMSASAGAIVVNMNAAPSSSNVTYNPANQTGDYGVAMVPGTQSNLAAAQIPAVVAATGDSCTDPWLASDFGALQSNSLCAHSLVAGVAPTTTQAGKVLPATETFMLTWDPHRWYWQTTRGYVQKFMSDVAAGSGQTSSPFALMGQYGSPAGPASYSIRYGGGCIDNGSVGGSACLFGSSGPHGPGYDYTAPTPASSTCSVTSGSDQWVEDPSGAWTVGPNSICITDSEIQAELQRMVPQTGMLTRVISGFKPLLVVVTPPSAVDCIDASGTLCSANSNAPARFCSYHGAVTMPDGSQLPYVVQPWTASWDQDPNKYPQLVTYGCDEADFVAKSPIPVNPPPDATTVAQDVGARLVSPLSQALIAAITNPFFTGWFDQKGKEINDNGCVPQQNVDGATVGTASYLLQREFNNGGTLAIDPNSPMCAENALLNPNFVAPSTVNQGDEVQFDGSATATTLLIPAAGYSWDFGDGTKAQGPSVVHTFAKAGTYTVSLKVTDRGGNSASFSQVVTVFTTAGTPAPPPSTGGAGGTGTGTGTGTGATGGIKPLTVHLQLMPQSLNSALVSGLRLRVNSNQSANGLVTVFISRAAAKRAHIAVGRSATVVIGRGTISQVRSGTITLRLGLSRRMARKLHALRHVTMTVRLALVPAVGRRMTIVIAGRY